MRVSTRIALNISCRLLAISVFLFAIVFSSCFAGHQTTSKATGKGDNPIDRYALVTRHNPVVHKPDPLVPLSVGNGEFAFTADITGLQTFPMFHRKGIPLCTQSQWGWHSFPNPENYRIEDTLKYYDSYGRKVGYPYHFKEGRAGEAAKWLRENPHRLHLGQIGLQLKRTDGSAVKLEDLNNTKQSLDLWSGLLTSCFEVENKPVMVQTCCHPDLDMIAVRIESPLLNTGQLSVIFQFPYGSPDIFAADWGKPDLHKTTLISKAKNRADFHRTLDADQYYVALAWSKGCTLKQAQQHMYILYPGDGNTLEFVCAFSPKSVAPKLPTVTRTQSICKAHWKDFWTQGGAIDLSKSKDPRANELERRIVLSQYLTAIQCAGSTPPQETGLTFNSWYGKFHLEMHWWHAVHFALWGRVNLLEKSLWWYDSILPKAKGIAKEQGYTGARWPKMAGPDGREGPSTIGPFLIWQQPHPIYYAELCYRTKPDRKTLERYKTIVFETAEFMASYATWQENKKRYVLGPPLIPAQEIFPPEETYNPTFELAYWAFGLETAQKWRERLGLPRNPKWNHVLEHLSDLPVKNGLYVNAQSHPDTFTDPTQRRDHPSLLAALGMLPPGKMADREIMRRTVRKVFDSWDWSQTWGWDYPLVAMTAARVGEPKLALDALLLDKPEYNNHYLLNGHCFQNNKNNRLPVYLPGNGGLLTAVAMMAAGWDGAPDRHAPGFPDDGSWTVQWEGLKPLP
jgi:protein-glucosylgalactosylhydroxylysine glucosidase